MTKQAAFSAKKNCRIRNQVGPDVSKHFWARLINEPCMKLKNKLHKTVTKDKGLSNYKKSILDINFRKYANLCQFGQSSIKSNQ